jgi:mandelate racemase
MATPSPEVSAHLLQVIQAAHWLQWVDWANPLRAEPFRVESGMLRIPGVPGCGINWDGQAVTRFAQAPR